MRDFQRGSGCFDVDRGGSTSLARTKATALSSDFQIDVTFERFALVRDWDKDQNGLEPEYRRESDDRESGWEVKLNGGRKRVRIKCRTLSRTWLNLRGRVLKGLM